MWSKRKRPMTQAERRHVERVKALPCGVCGADGPSEAHELRQGQWHTAHLGCQEAR
jgi:hypothetical protein